VKKREGFLHPLVPLEIDQHPSSQNDYQPPPGRVAPFPRQFRDLGKIHAVYTGKKREGDENGGEDILLALHQLRYTIWDSDQFFIRSFSDHAYT